MRPDPMTGSLERLILLRHGQSRGNQRDEIVSRPDRGQALEEGLTDLGRRQVRASVRQALENQVLNGSEVVFASPFTRTLETARIACRELGIPWLFLEDRLRERSFGELEGTRASQGYPRVWELDRRDATHTKLGVESVLAVRERVVGFLEGLDRPGSVADAGAGRPARVLVVLHGDVGQIAETVLRGMDPGHHRELPSLKPAEIRCLIPGP